MMLCVMVLCNSSNLRHFELCLLDWIGIWHIRNFSLMIQIRIEKKNIVRIEFLELKNVNKTSHFVL